MGALIGDLDRVSLDYPNKLFNCLSFEAQLCLSDFALSGEDRAGLTAKRRLGEIVAGTCFVC